MGVTGLWKLIDQSGTPVPLESLENKILAVDISIWLHQSVKGFQDASGAGLPHAHLLGLYHRICKLLYYRIRPVFVFDGGIPYLKRETMKKRAVSKNTYRTEADRLQKLLAQSVERELLIRQALGGPSTSSSTTSPLKDRLSRTDKDKEDMFILPPLPEADALSQNNSFTSLDESSSSIDECSQKAYGAHLQSIDVTSKHFLGLPADVRHEILTDLKAMRKESSWGRLHELPEQSNEFSDFQMKRLLKRRLVQQSLETAEQEMGGKSLSIGEIEKLLKEDGVVDDDVSAYPTQRIMSDEHIRFLHVRNLKKVMCEEKKATALQKEDEGGSPPKKIKIENRLDDTVEVGEQTAVQDHEMCFPPSQLKNETIQIKDDGEEDEELQKAIQMSLEDCVVLTPDVKNQLQVDSVQMKEDDEDLELQKSIQLSLKEDVVLTPNLKDSKQQAIKLNVNDEDITLISEDNMSDVSSNADSDFIDVPEADSDCSLTLPSQTSFELQIAPTPDQSTDFRHSDLHTHGHKTATTLEVFIDPTKALSKDTDLFADVFANVENPVSPKIVTLPVESNQEEHLSASQLSQMKCPSDFTAPAESKLNDILSKLNAEMDTLVSVSTNDASLDIPQEEENRNDDVNKFTTSTQSPTMNQKPIDSFVEVTPTKTFPKNDSSETPPPKIASPFFRKKTPTSTCKSKDYGSPIDGGPSNSSAKKSLFSDEPSTSSGDIRQQLAADLKSEKSAGELIELASETRQNTRDLLAERNKQDRLGSSITDRMSEDCKRLLRMFGVPFVVAPMEAEAQCAYLDASKLTDGTITDDSDIWLFGGRTVYKHFFNQAKVVQEFRAESVKRLYNVDRSNLIQLAMLVGSDYTTGVSGIGTVTALEILSLFQTNQNSDSLTEKLLLASLQHFKEWFQDTKMPSNKGLRKKLKNIALANEFPNGLVIQSYLYPEVNDKLQTFSWRDPDAETLREFAKMTFGWTFAKTDETLQPVLKRMQEKRSQQSIRNYFTTQGVVERKEITVSKRVRKAIDQLSQPQRSDTDEPAEVSTKRKPRKPRNVKTKSTTNETNEEATSSQVGKRNGRVRRIDDGSAAAASTSTASVSKKEPRIPDFQPPIRQRQMADKEQQKKKERAAAVFRESKKRNAKK